MERLKIKSLPAIDAKGEFYWSSEDRPLQTVDTLVLHSMYNYESNLESEQFSAKSCRNLLIATAEGLSTHYIIDKSGVIYQCVPLNRKAWHAGVSKMPAPDNRTGVNAFSVGIEMLYKEDEAPNNAQYHSAVILTAYLAMGLPIKFIVGHNHIAGHDVRPPDKVKVDPWNFNWNRFRLELGHLTGSLTFGDQNFS